MNTLDACDNAYKNGYEKGYEDALKMVEELLNKVKGEKDNVRNN